MSRPVGGANMATVSVQRVFLLWTAAMIAFMLFEYNNRKSYSEVKNERTNSDSKNSC